MPGFGLGARQPLQQRLFQKRKPFIHISAYAANQPWNRDEAPAMLKGEPQRGSVHRRRLEDARGMEPIQCSLTLRKRGHHWPRVVPTLGYDPQARWD